MQFISHCTVPYCSSRRGFFTPTLALIGLNRHQGASKLALSNYFRDWEKRKNNLQSKICLETACWKTILIKEVASNWQTISKTSASPCPVLYSENCQFLSLLAPRLHVFPCENSFSGSESFLNMKGGGWGQGYPIGN